MECFLGFACWPAARRTLIPLRRPRHRQKNTRSGRVMRVNLRQRRAKAGP